MFSIFGNPFIHPAAYEPEPQPSLAPLFRLLSDFDNYHAEAPQQCQRRTAPEARRSALNTPRAALTRTTTFTPKFDVRETATTYELHGEFPGLQRENVQIEFVEPQTLAIRGRVERRYETKPEEPAAAAPEEPAAQPTESEAAAAPADEVEVDWEDVRSEASSSSSTRSNYHRPTVEDDAENEDGQSVVSTPRTVASEASKPATPTPAPEKAAAKEVQKPAPAPAPVKAAANGRFWLVEREVGEFSRTFSFAERVDQDKVQATLENGILTVSVPKAARHVVRRVVIF